ncbi:MAG: AzlC family ABC transporter permease [Bacillota bacterium]
MSVAPFLKSPQNDAEISFSQEGFLIGFRQSIPIGLSVFAYGLVFGVLARQAGLSLTESVIMSGLVFAGASQFAAVALWQMPLPVTAIIITTLVINLRHILMGAALYPWFSKMPRVKAYGSLFFMNDESWALTMASLTRGEKNGAFLLGSGLIVFMFWLAATIIGRTLGSVLQDPSLWGLDFAFTAVFLALLVGFWKGKKDVLPWAVAAVVSLAASHWLPGKWYIVLGGLVGSCVGAVRHAE